MQEKTSVLLRSLFVAMLTWLIGSGTGSILLSVLTMVKGNALADDYNDQSYTWIVIVGMGILAFLISLKLFLPTIPLIAAILFILHKPLDTSRHGIGAFVLLFCFNALLPLVALITPLLKNNIDASLAMMLSLLVGSLLFIAFLCFVVFRRSFGFRLLLFILGNVIIIAVLYFKSEPGWLAERDKLAWPVIFLFFQAPATITLLFFAYRFKLIKS